jgi:uncharacterized membrane protein
MPWCPKCKIEYIEGKTTCNDCGTELVDELPEELAVFMKTEKEKLAQKFVQFLRYSNIDSATYEYDEEKKTWLIYVKKESVKQVTKLYKAFYSVEVDQQLSELTEDIANDEEDAILEDIQEESSEYLEMDNDASGDFTEDELSNEENSEDTTDSMFDKEELEEILESTKEKPIISSTYVKKEEKYKDLKSTAYTFIVVSVIGIAVLILNFVGIISIFNSILAYIVMGALFVIFFIIGIQSFSSAKKVKSQITEENNTTEAIKRWLSENVTAEQLDSLTKEETTEEIRFFNKLEKMKNMIITQFGELDDSYLDLLVEEYYNENYDR